MASSQPTDRDTRYLEIITRPIRVCATYKPKMGHGSKAGLSLQDFQRMYAADPFYTWFGLGNPLMYAAHKAAGGMTSVYRQIGIGCEDLLRTILQDQLGLSKEESTWSYSIVGANKKERRLSLDARIPIEAVRHVEQRKCVREWITEMGRELGVAPKIARLLQGVVFEVRQGYKSKDSKRQNADIANAASAYTQAYLPCVLLMSSQMDSDIIARYHNEKWAILLGQVGERNPRVSTYDFFREIVGFDLAGFFERHAGSLRLEVAAVLETLLRTE